MSDETLPRCACVAIQSTARLAVGAGVPPIVVAAHCLLEAIELYRASGWSSAQIDAFISEMLVTHHGA